MSGVPKLFSIISMLFWYMYCQQDTSSTGEPGHEAHEKPVVPDVICSHDDEIEEVPHARVTDKLDDELANQVVGVVAVAIQERR